MGRNYVFILYIFATALIVLVKDSVQDDILLTEEQEDCDCGAYSHGCTKVNESVICNCSVGYSQHEDFCDVCECGANSNKCFFKGGEKACECKVGFFDRNGTCAEDFCWKEPCKNGGTCINSEDAHKCTCVESFVGQNCTETWCERNLKEICKETCVYDFLLKEGYCKCKENQVFDETKRNCTAIDPCLSKLLKGECNKPHETCESGECRCKKNYKYSKNNDSCVANFCGEDPCPPYSSCKEVESGNIQCTCYDGYYRKDGKCEKVDLCLFSGCNQKCDSLSGVCSCIDGFELSKDNKTCTSSTVKCDKDCGDLTCHKAGGNETCFCPEVTHIDEKGVCKSFRDICNATRKAPEKLCPTDECEMANTGIGFRCVCEGVYKQAEDGVRCERKVMCEEKEGKEKCAEQFAVCKEIPRDDRLEHSFQCVCREGYERDDQGVCRKKCELKEHIEACARKSAICDLDEKFNVVCRCPPMLKMKDDQCTKVAEFSYLGKLRVLKNKYEIQPSDARFSKSSYNVDVPMLLTDLKNSLEKMVEVADLKLLNYRTDGEDIDCSVELQLVDEPTLTLNKIKTGKFCTPVSKPGYCLVQPELFIKNSTEDVFQISKPCEPHIKEKLCGDATTCVGEDFSNFQCTCIEGYEPIGVIKPFTSPNSYIQLCSDLDECKIASVCPDSTTCKNVIGGYECQCKQGYIQKPETDTKKEGCKRLCDPNPCQNGECVVIDGNSWTCNCNANWTGILCNTSAAIITTKEDGLATANTTAIVGGVLGALLAVVLIAFIAVLLKKKKGGLDQDDYITQRQQGVRSEMNRIAQRKQYLEEEQVADLRARGDSGERARQSRQERIIPRAQIPKRTEERPRQSTNEAAYYKNSAYVGD